MFRPDFLWCKSVGQGPAAGPPLKRKSVAAESAFRGAAGQLDSVIQQPRAPTYSDFSGPMTEVLCQVIKVSICEAGIYTVKETGLFAVSVASDVPEEMPLQDTHLGRVGKPIYGTGLLGIGKTKRAIFVCIPYAFEPICST